MTKNQKLFSQPCEGLWDGSVDGEKHPQGSRVVM